MLLFILLKSLQPLWICHLPCKAAVVNPLCLLHQFHEGSGCERVSTRNFITVHRSPSPGRQCPGGPLLFPDWGWSLAWLFEARMEVDSLSKLVSCGATGKFRGSTSGHHECLYKRSRQSAHWLCRYFSGPMALTWLKTANMWPFADMLIENLNHITFSQNTFHHWGCSIWCLHSTQWLLVMASVSGAKGSIKRDHLIKWIWNQIAVNLRLIEQRLCSDLMWRSSSCLSVLLSSRRRSNMAGKPPPRCSCIIPVLPASSPFPQMSSLFFSSSCHPKGYAGCISVTHSPVDCRVKCQRLPPFLTPPPCTPLPDFFYFHTFTSSSSLSLIGDFTWLRVC